MNRRALFYGSLAALMLLLAAPAFAQDGPRKEPYDTSGQDGGMWLIEGASTYTKDVDILWRVIFWLVIAMFVLTEGLLIFFCIVYRRRPGHRPIYTHGNRKAEIIWTIVPACMLLALAIVQIGTWDRIKQPSLFPKAGPGVTAIDVFAETFSWNYRYPGTKQLSEEKKWDITSGRLNVPFGDKVVCRLRSRDVIHSMFIPHMRVKQDTVPGLRQGLWFEPARMWLVELDPTTKKGTKKHWINNPLAFDAGVDTLIDGKPVKLFDKRIALDTIPASNAYDENKQGVYDVIRVKTPQGEITKTVNVLYQGKVMEKQQWAACDYAVGIFEIACAELCGMGHYKMRSTMCVLPRAAYQKWLEDEAFDVGEPSNKIWKLWKD